MRGNLRAIAEFCNMRVPCLLVLHLDLLLGYGHRVEVNIIISKVVCRLLRPYIPNSLVRHDEVKIILKLVNVGIAQKQDPTQSLSLSPVFEWKP